MQSETEKLAFPGSHHPDTPLDDEASVSVYGGIGENNVKVRVTAVRGRGFQIKKRKLGQKDDVPDVYLNIRLISQRGPRSSEVWKTATVKDDTMPRWNEARTFSDVRPTGDTVRVDAYDKNSTHGDECLGAAEFGLEQLLRKRSIEMELFDQATGTGAYVTLMCVQLHDEHVTDGGNKLPTKMTDGKDGPIKMTDGKDGKDGKDGRVTEVVHGRNAGYVRNDNCDQDEEEEGDVLPPLKTISVTRPSPLMDDDDQSMQSWSSTSSTSSMRSISKRMKKSMNPKKLGKKLSKKFSRHKS